jgi:hypothetical protein
VPVYITVPPLQVATLLAGLPEIVVSLCHGWIKGDGFAVKIGSPEKIALPEKIVRFLKTDLSPGLTDAMAVFIACHRRLLRGRLVFLLNRR